MGVGAVGALGDVAAVAVAADAVGVDGVAACAVGVGGGVGVGVGLGVGGASLADEVSARVDLGAPIAENEDGFHMMKFTQGETCENGVVRSVDVTIKCALENR